MIRCYNKEKNEVRMLPDAYADPYYQRMTGWEPMPLPEKQQEILPQTEEKQKRKPRSTQP